ncbi:hypothetical protein DYB32_009046 [Aphanomyces invadans]|uniref:Pentacotripeptide-repeat region of PRORP domain-containing protein n=1 Tax=Aphanomyces invadans TaxID=157072 RepID=A0A3R6Z3T7_9STRA|nr:hypothetical protein DYB32_009046 [Aphanomyces invadans]
MRNMCNRGEFAAVVQEVAKLYQPLASALQSSGSPNKRKTKSTEALPSSNSHVLFNPDMTAHVESEAMALLVQHRATDAALLLLDNLQEMAAASSDVKPKRQTMSFILGMLTFNRRFPQVLAAYDFATSLSIFPTESMNANYLGALVRTTQFYNAAKAWRKLSAQNCPRGVYAYREALHIFSTLRDAKEIMAILDDVEVHGIKLREIDYARAMTGLSSAIDEDADKGHASDCADLILDLYDKMQTFESITPISPQLFGSVMEAAVYMKDYDKALAVYQDYSSLPTAQRTKGVDHVSGPLIYALLGSDRRDEALGLLAAAHAQKNEVEASAIAGRLAFYYASNGLDADLMAFLAECPQPLRLHYRNDKELLTVLHKVTRTAQMHEVDLWTFLLNHKQLLHLDVRLWWWKLLMLAEGAKKWRLMRLMLSDQSSNTSGVKPQQWRAMLKNCARRVTPNDVEGYAFIVYVAERMGGLDKGHFTLPQLQALVTAYSQTNDHANAIAVFQHLHKLCSGDKDATPPTAATYESAKKSFLALGYDAEANQIDAILKLHQQVVPPA